VGKQCRQGIDCHGPSGYGEGLHRDELGLAMTGFEIFFSLSSPSAVLWMASVLCGLNILKSCLTTKITKEHEVLTRTDYSFLRGSQRPSW